MIYISRGKPHETVEEHKSMKSEDQKLFKEAHVVKISVNFIFGFYVPLGTMLHFISLSCDSVSPTELTKSASPKEWLLWTWLPPINRVRRKISHQNIRAETK